MRMSLALALPALILVASAPARAQADRLVVLEQMASNGRLYFYNTLDDTVIVRGSRGIRTSNVLVYVDREVRSNIQTWHDPAGHLHTLAVLKIQLAFNEELSRREAEWNREHQYQSGRPAYRAPEGVAAVDVDGVMGRSTLLIPYMKLKLRSEALEAAYRRRCREALRSYDAYRCYSSQAASTGSASLNAWAARIDEARAAMEPLGEGARAVPLHRPRWIVGLDGWRDRVYSGVHLNLDDVPALDREVEHGQRLPYTGLRVRPPELSVDASANAGRLSALRALERQAVQEFERAERLGEELFGR
ncbi:MAG: hypothetical protein HY059_09295 [Proteobacteria bacterium]|nr:hypothetical protein [Pseudomonadota bacterium]